MRTSFGACRRRARLHARLGSTIPTKPTSPTLSWRAAWQTINSCALKCGPSIAIVDRLTVMRSRFQPLDVRTHTSDILAAIAYPVYPLFQILIEQRFVLRNLAPANIEVVVAIIKALCEGRMTTERFMDYGAHDHSRNQGAVRIGANDPLRNNLFSDHDRVTRSKRSLLLYSDQSPDLRVAILVGALSVNDRRVRIQCRHCRQFFSRERASDCLNQRIDARKIAAHVISERIERQSRRAGSQTRDHSVVRIFFEFD